MMDEKRQHIIFLTVGLVLLCTAAVLLHSFKGQFGRESVNIKSVPGVPQTIEASDGVQGAVTKPQQVSSSPSLPNKWVVYVTGAVKKPGVYNVPVDSRTYVALNAAGGFTDKADPAAVNLAALLQDGVQINFPAKGESRAQPAVSGSGAVQPQSAQPAAKAAASAQSAAGTLVNINTATAAELETISGVGPKTAEAIIQYRTAHGGFARIEDLLQIKGIGPKKYDAIKGMITVGK
jgi:competence protein ComEA